MMYSKSIIKLSGMGEITAPINHFGILLGFDTQKKGNFIIPKVNIHDFDIEFDVSKFVFKFDCNACPSTVINFLMNLVKGPVLSKIRSEAQKIVKTKVVDIINEKLLEHYPTTIPVGETMSMGLATTGPIKVKSTYLKAPIDGTFFKTSEGYNRPSEPDLIPSENPINPGEILLFTSPHILNTLSKTIAKTPISINQVIKGYNITIDFDARNYPFKLYTEFDNIVVKGAVNITVPSLDLKLEIGGRSELGLFFRPGDKNNTIYLDPDIDEYSLKFDLFRVYIKGIRVNFNWATGLANYIIGIILNNKTIPKIPIEKSPILPLTATAAVLRLFDTYSEIGVKFDFNLFNE